MCSVVDNREEGGREKRIEGEKEREREILCHKFGTLCVEVE
jgi:hypothetical protein